MDLPPPPSPDPELWRLAGSVGGAVVAFLIAWPKSWADFGTRLAVSVITGFAAGPVAQEFYFHWPASPRYDLFSAFACTFLAWPVVGAIWRLVTKPGFTEFLARVIGAKKGE